ncbi:hypothetical protein KZZ52_19305 [Dactylosporangium sp. AC04546]|nr:hypothetical protein [Dactylosporangium sp. AC04546]WVK87450.1 hypothetical protein KZZ52_19305 [Dactylosporangium sp. AC04546]
MLTLVFGFAQLVLQASGSALAAGVLPAALTGCSLLAARLSAAE